MAEFVQTTLMDGYAGGPHITEAQLGLAHQATFGPDDYVLEGGRESEAQVLTNNSIRIFDAVYCIQGRRDVIPASGYTDVTIDNGTQGMNRNDIIVRRYKKDEVSEEESTEYAVIKGTPSSGEAVDPSVTTGDIRSGAILHEMKLYRVKLTGLNIVEVEPLFNILKNQATLQKEIAQSNKDLSDKVAELNGKSGKLIENQRDYQVYTLLDGKVKVISGSVIKTGVGKNYIALFSDEQLKNLFGVTVDTTRLSVSTFNGDDVSQAVQFYAPENWQGSIYQYFSSPVSGNIRINYRIVYVYE
ncbi:hypothetical protein [Dorea sp. AM58-8]|uniref:hypothetical protein n=1 Tax=Dorea sp. AM58-8 TaxID=2292346 RepID=UPI000E5291EB|nr:hypothetical protein [Dorea sp. AM58-8]RGY83219.1 hypothetical protein DXA18_00640 [Dorea sp. AM58-8]